MKRGGQRRRISPSSSLATCHLPLSDAHFFFLAVEVRLVFSGGRTDLATPETAPRAAPEASSLRTSLVPGPPAWAGEAARVVGEPGVTAVGSLATADAAPVTAPTTAPATTVSRTSPVFSIKLFTTDFRVVFGLDLAPDAPLADPLGLRLVAVVFSFDIGAAALPALLALTEADRVGLEEVAFALTLGKDAAFLLDIGRGATLGR